MEEMKPIFAQKEQVNEDEYDFNFEKSPISQLHDMIMRQLPKESDAIDGSVKTSDVNLSFYK